MKKIIILLLFLFLIPKSFANDLGINDETKTIRELKENIEELGKDKNLLRIKTNGVSQGDTLKGFLRKDLNNEDIEELKNIINIYNKKRKDLEKHLYLASKKLIDTKEIKVKLLKEKKTFFKKLTPFIKISNYSAYLEFIKSDTSIYSEKKDIDSDIIRKKEIISNKIDILEKRIKRHKSFLEDNLNNLVEKKLEEKITQLSLNIDFINLTTENKIKVLEKTIFKIKNSINDIVEINNLLETTPYNITLNQKKIEIYNITLEKLENFKATFK